MNISELSIRRPVLATVMTVIILLFGVIGYFYLGVREYPSVDNPIISVQCSYAGANADVIENQITEPLEQNINGIPGIRSLTSVSQQGSSRITVEFDLSVDLETAANDVRDKVSRAQRYLPRDCDPPTVSKADADASPILMVALQSEKRPLLELSEIADLTVKEQLQTIPDVSSVSIWGEKKYSMRLWLDPIKMAGYGITPMDVKNAVDNENVELPSGSIEGNTIELEIRTMGLMNTAKMFDDLIIKHEGNQIIRFSDIGRAELGAADIKSYMKMNGVPMVGVVVIPQPGANHIDIADAVYERMEKMKKDLPDDVHYSYGFDNTKFIRASISEVEKTVYEAFVLVIIIIFLFLRDWRVTLIPCIVIPVSLIGSFFVMYLMGFSINVLTMLAVVLAVGLVVDDAIVMTENIYIRIERGMPPMQAGIEGAKEIFFAVVSTTITLVAVFFPIVFMEGTTGRLFREFSMVISGSIIISAFAALTFTLLLADNNSAVVQAEYKKVMSRDYPYVNLNVGYGYTMNRYELAATKKRDNWGLSAGVTVGFNIFDGKRRMQKNNAQLDIEYANLERENLKLSLKASLNNYWQAYKNNLQILQKERENHETAVANYGLSYYIFSEGQLSGFELREAQNSLLESEESILTAEYDTKMCEVSLMLLSGKVMEYLAGN